mgnify:FL=1|jgi:hypothetical protein
MKYKVDEWVIYIPYPNDEIESLAKIKKIAVILNILPKDDFYDYEIFIDGEGKIKKVSEDKLFPRPEPTY